MYIVPFINKTSTQLCVSRDTQYRQNDRYGRSPIHGHAKVFRDMDRLVQKYFRLSLIKIKLTYVIRLDSSYVTHLGVD